MVASTTSGIKDKRVDRQDLIIVKEDDNELVVHFPTPEKDLDWFVIFYRINNKKAC